MVQVMMSASYLEKNLLFIYLRITALSHVSFITFSSPAKQQNAVFVKAIGQITF